MIYIYGLTCPISGAVRYIGKSTNPQRRLRAHIGAAIRCAYDHHTARWIRRLDASGQRPLMSVLAQVAHGEDWREVERMWIRRAIQDNWPLTNSTAGGEGLDYIDPAAEQAYRKNHRAAMRRLA